MSAAVHSPASRRICSSHLQASATTCQVSLKLAARLYGKCLQLLFQMCVKDISMIRVCVCLCVLAWTAITIYHGLDGVDNRNGLFTVLEV